MAEQVRVRVQFPPHNTEQLGLGAAKRGFELSKAAHLASKIKTGFTCVFLITAGAKHSLGQNSLRLWGQYSAFWKGEKRLYLLATPWG